MYSDPTNLNSFGLRVGVAADVEYCRNEYQENITASLRDLRVSSRRPLDQSYHISDVLTPCTVRFTANKTTEKESCDVTIDRMAIR